MAAKNISILILFCMIASNAFSQSNWQTLTNAPIADSGVSRYDDTYFINSNTGWIIQGTSYLIQNDTGKVYKTTDGGNSWILANHKIPVYLRSLGFINANTGFIGTIGDTVHPLYKTTDGGFNWTDVKNTISGIVPKGICGISIVNSSIAYACGKYTGPGNVIKTTNGGVNWISLPVDNNLFCSLVDCYFWSADSGIIVGGYASSGPCYAGHAAVMMTVNGGMNWTRVYLSSRNIEYCWKIQFVNKQLGYVSIDNFAPPTYILKTTNGGSNWQEILLPSECVDMEGVGFINENTGWVGGWGAQQNNFPNYETTNGGLSWHLAGWGLNVNRFRFLNDTLAYAVGKTVYKYSNDPIGIHQISSEVPVNFTLEQNYPNPFNPTTYMEFGIPELGHVTLKIYDVLGKEIQTLVNESLLPGKYKVNFSATGAGRNFASGVYFYRLTEGEYTETRRMILTK